MSRPIVLFLTLTTLLMAACTSTPELPDLPEVSSGPSADEPSPTGIRELPKTASRLPALGLTGAASVLAALGVRTLRRRLF